MLRRLLLPLLALVSAFAAPSLAVAQSKIGVINLQRAVLGTADIKKASAEMQAKYKPRQDQLAKLQQELAEIQAKLQGGNVSPAVGEDLQAQGQQKQREAQRISEDLQGDADRERNEILQKAGARMTEVVKKLADEKGLDLVVESTSTMYFKSALEITDDAIAAYDKAYPVK